MSSLQSEAVSRGTARVWMSLRSVCDGSSEDLSPARSCTFIRRDRMIGLTYGRYDRVLPGRWSAQTPGCDSLGVGFRATSSTGQDHIHYHRRSWARQYCRRQWSGSRKKIEGAKYIWLGVVSPTANIVVNGRIPAIYQHQIAANMCCFLDIDYSGTTRTLERQ